MVQHYKQKPSKGLDSSENVKSAVEAEKALQPDGWIVVIKSVLIFCSTDYNYNL